MRRALTLFILAVSVLALTAPQPAATGEASVTTVTTWTIMIYMAANSSPELPWEQNLNEIEAAQEANGTNILALVDPYGGGNTTLYKVAHDPGGLNTDIVSQQIDDGGAVIPTSTRDANMASPSTLDAFIEFSASLYPADVYMLVLWGHGAGWRGFCPDGQDILTVGEMNTAISVANIHIGKTLDILALDACAGATLELIYELRGDVRYLVGSEKDVPAQGLPYKAILDNLATNTGRTPKDIASMMAEEYVSWSRGSSYYSATMTAFEISSWTQEMQIFTERFYQWAHLLRWYEGLFHEDLRAVYMDAEHYETEWQVDFGSLGSRILNSSLPEEVKYVTRNVLESYNDLIVYFGSFDNPDAIDGIRAREPTGAVIYAPSAELADQPYWLEIRFTGWEEFSHMLRRNASTNVSDPGPTLLYTTEEDFGPGLFDTVTISWPSAYLVLHVWAFRQEASGLVYAGEYNGTGSNITIHNDNAVGSLILSSSAGSNNATSEAYARIGPLSLTAAVRMNVTMTGMPDYDGRIRLTFNTSAGVLVINSTDNGSHVIPIVLLTPRDLWLNDKIALHVETRKYVGDAETWVNGTQVDVTVEMRAKPPASGGWQLTVVMVLLAAAFILIFAFLLYRERKRAG